MQSWTADRRNRLFPSGKQIPVSAKNPIAAIISEYPRVRTVLHILGQMFDDHRLDRLGQGVSAQTRRSLVGP